MRFSQLKKGKTVYRPTRHFPGHPNLEKVVWSTVEIVSVRPADKTVYARWNNNPPALYWDMDYKQWREKPDKC